MNAVTPQHIEMVPISRITVLNPRARNKRQHREIANNIEAIGLKRPITVSRRSGPGGPRYDLVCGEGRLEAFQMLGQTDIPAVVIEASESECLVMSLVENIARRIHRPIDIMKEIGALHARGHIPLKALRDGVHESKKYAQIVSSIKAIGLVEAPVVIAAPGDSGQYYLLDGHLRIEVLKQLSIASVECLVATDEDTYSYNKRINRLPPVQEHRMIVRAIERGVAPAQIADALGLKIQTVKRRSRLLDGISSDAAEMLKETNCPIAVFDTLRRMSPLRQVEAADLMIGQNNFTAAFAKALLAATPDDQLAKPPKSQNGKANASPNSQQLARMERELAVLQTRIKSVEDSYGIDNLHLTLARGYVAKLLGNAGVVRWLSHNRQEYLAEFQRIAEIDTLAAGTELVLP